MTISLQPLDKRLKRYAKEHGLRQDTVELDYLLSWLLAAIASDTNLGTHLVFKGGTALKKCYFNNYRFSEDLDFTALPNAMSGASLEQQLILITKKAEEAMNEYAPVVLLGNRYEEKEAHPDGQEAFTVRAQLPG